MTGNVLIRIAIYIVVIYIGLNVLAFLFSDTLIFNPKPPSYSRLPHEVKITTAGGETITAVYLEHPAAEYTILFSHGNAEDLGTVMPFMENFFEQGYSVLMYDYRGYGTSEGEASVPNTYEDVDAAYQWLVREKGVVPETIISQGRSVGGGPASWLAAHRNVGGLVLECSFVTAFRVRTVIPLLPWDKYNNLQHVRMTTCPVLIVHGRNDKVIPFWHGEKLYNEVPGKKAHLWIDGAEHNNYAYVAGARYIEAFESLIELVTAEALSELMP